MRQSCVREELNQLIATTDEGRPRKRVEFAGPEPQGRPQVSSDWVGEDRRKIESEANSPWQRKHGSLSSVTQFVKSQILISARFLPVSDTSPFYSGANRKRGSILLKLDRPRMAVRGNLQTAKATARPTARNYCCHCYDYLVARPALVPLSVCALLLYVSHQFAVWLASRFEKTEMWTYFTAKMWQNLEPGSSPIDWCENNYKFSPVIAEFTNTFSNILFFLMPPVLIHLFREYGRFANPGIHVIWILLMVVGLCSAYFHATLSFIGQLLDELAILWVLAAALAMFFPRRHFPGIFKNDRRKFGYTIISLAVVATGLAFLYPFANAFALMGFSILVVVLLATELRRNVDQRVQRLGNRCAIAWVVATVLWTTDRMFCSTWLSLDFPYLHALFHICIFIVSYTACVLFAFFAVKDERPDLCPTLKYWPRDHFELGVPYITVKNGSHQI